MEYDMLAPRQAPPPGNLSDIIWTDPDEVPMFIPLTPEQLAALPHPNYAPKLMVTLWVLLGLATLFLALRLDCKFSRHRGAWWDDWFLVGAWVRLPFSTASASTSSCLCWCCLRTFVNYDTNGVCHSYASSPSPRPSRKPQHTATAATGSTGPRCRRTGSPCSSSLMRREPAP